MGIKGLLPLLKNITHQTSLEDLRGKAVAIDTLCWLHRGVYSCADDLAQGRPSRAYVTFCEKMLDLLLHFGIIPYFVFDGANLPAKRGTETERRANRAEALKQGLAALAAGDAAGARAAFVRAVDVTPQMAFEFIKVLRQRGIAYVVAPYEADAQLAFLFRAGIVEAVITEDSDLLPFGTGRVLYKLDKASGTAQEVQLAHLAGNGDPSFLHWTDDMFLSFCILSGCDYLPSLPGMGPRAAHTFVKCHKTQTAILRVLKFEKETVLPPDYLNAFSRARLTFLHQRVWDPRSGRLVTLTPMPPGVLAALGAHFAPPDGAAVVDSTAGVLDFLGPAISDDLARAIAEARIDPITQLPYIEGDPAPLPRGIAAAAAAPSAAAAAGAAALRQPQQMLLHTKQIVQQHGAARTKPAAAPPASGFFSRDIQRTRVNAAAAGATARPAPLSSATSFALAATGSSATGAATSRPFQLPFVSSAHGGSGGGATKRSGTSLAPHLPFASVLSFGGAAACPAPSSFFVAAVNTPRTRSEVVDFSGVLSEGEAGPPAAVAVSSSYFGIAAKKKALSPAALGGRGRPEPSQLLRHGEGSSTSDVASAIVTPAMPPPPPPVEAATTHAAVAAEAWEAVCDAEAAQLDSEAGDPPGRGVEALAESGARASAAPPDRPASAKATFSTLLRRHTGDPAVGQPPSVVDGGRDATEAERWDVSEPLPSPVDPRLPAARFHAASSRVLDLINRRPTLGISLPSLGAGLSRGPAAALAPAPAAPRPPDIYRADGAGGPEVLTLGARPDEECAYLYSGDEDIDEGGGYRGVPHVTLCEGGEAAGLGTEGGGGHGPGRIAGKRPRAPALPAPFVPPAAGAGAAAGSDLSPFLHAGRSPGAAAASVAILTLQPRGPKRSAGMPRAPPPPRPPGPLGSAPRSSSGNVGRSLHALRSSPRGGAPLQQLAAPPPPPPPLPVAGSGAFADQRHRDAPESAARWGGADAAGDAVGEGGCVERNGGAIVAGDAAPTPAPPAQAPAQQRVAPSWGGGSGGGGGGRGPGADPPESRPPLALLQSRGASASAHNAGGGRGLPPPGSSALASAAERGCGSYSQQPWSWAPPRPTGTPPAAPLAPGAGAGGGVGLNLLRRRLSTGLPLPGAAAPSSAVPGGAARLWGGATSSDSHGQPEVGASDAGGGGSSEAAPASVTRPAGTFAAKYFA